MTFLLYLLYVGTTLTFLDCFYFHQTVEFNRISQVQLTVMKKITWNNPKKDVSFSYKPLRRFSEQHLAKVIRQHGWNLSFWALIVAVLSYYPRGYFCFVVISDTHVEGKCYDYRWTMLQCFPLKELITWMKNKVLSCFLKPMFYMIFLLWNDLQAEKVSEEEN